MLHLHEAPFAGQQVPEREQAMNDVEMERPIAGETEVSEQTGGEPLPADAPRERPTRSVVYSIRLTAEQSGEIQRIACAAGIPAVGLVRGWVLQRLAAEQESPAELTRPDWPALSGQRQPLIRQRQRRS